MIVTVTPNPAIDRIVIVRGFRTAAVNRATVDRVDIGGKGINVAQNLARLGCEHDEAPLRAADLDGRIQYERQHIVQHAS